MQLIGLQVRNYRSIVDSGEIRIDPIEAFVGENNAGKSNLIYAVQLFLTSGSGGVDHVDFYDENKPIVISATFGNLPQPERRKLRKYLLGDKLILEKVIKLEVDRRSGRVRPNAEYHGYIANPKDWWLSTEKVIEHENTSRPNWSEIANAHGISEYVTNEDGNVNKSTYETGIAQYIVEHDEVEFDDPILGDTQALGFQSVLVDALPVFRLLPAITDYSSEIDRRTSKTNFHLLMGDLASRILKNDSKYSKLEEDFQELEYLLNPLSEDDSRKKGQERLTVLDDVENSLQGIIARLMPSVKGVKVRVDLENLSELFSRGVSIWVDDGTLTEVNMKGHGLQRCIVFGLIQALILNQRGKLIKQTEKDEDEKNGGEIQKSEDDRTIILAIEEPELYIHPQTQRLIYSVLRDFSQTDQVLYCTHSPSFVDITNYSMVSVVRKDSLEKGTKVYQCEMGELDAKNERKTFQFLTSFGIEKNNMFFARRVVLVEGEEDIVAYLAAGRKAEIYREFPEEIGYTIIASESKNEMVKFMKLLNAFHIPYVIVHELDGEPDDELNKSIEELLGNNRRVCIETRLEDVAGHEGHFKKIYTAKKYFENSENITKELVEKTIEIFSDPEIVAIDD